MAVGGVAAGTVPEAHDTADHRWPVGSVAMRQVRDAGMVRGHKARQQQTEAGATVRVASG